MSDLSVASVEPLLLEEVPRSISYGRKASVLLGFLVGLGFAALALLSRRPFLLANSGSWTLQAPAVEMAWQSMPARAAQVIQPANFMQAPRVLALPGLEANFKVTRNVWENGLTTGLRMNMHSVPSALPGSRDLHRPSALSDRGLMEVPEDPAVVDVREILRSSPAEKCVYADRHASLCGNLVVLRPSTAVRASTDKKSQTLDADGIIKDISQQLDTIEDKPQAALYVGGALVAVVVTNGILTSLKSLPLVPDLLELIGTGYTAWFTYRYLLFQGSRKELLEDIEELKNNLLR